MADHSDEAGTCVRFILIRTYIRVYELFYYAQGLCLHTTSKKQLLQVVARARVSRIKRGARVARW